MVAKKSEQVIGKGQGMKAEGSQTYLTRFGPENGFAKIGRHKNKV